MPSIQVMPPFKVFADTHGEPLEDGRIYIGAPNQNPEIVPVGVYWDADLTIPALQPIHTTGGYPSRSGTPAQIFVDSLSYSILVRDKNGALVYISLNAENDTAIGILGDTDDPSSGAALIGRGVQVVNSIADLRDLLKTSASKNAFVAGYYIPGDGGGGEYYCDVADVSSADNGGTVIVAADGGRWKLTYTNTLSVKQFGAKGDGVAADTSAFQSIIAALPGGGIIYVPNGKYRITSTLMLHGGLTFQGATCVNNVFGLPTGAERPSHIYLDSPTANAALFKHPINVQMESLQFYDLSFGARQVPSITPNALQTGFEFIGSWPNDIKHMTFERCGFANFGGYAIRVFDPNAGGINPDWNVAPVVMTDCTFYYNTIGIEFEADNADVWTMTNCAFFSNTYGVNLKRSGFVTMTGCFGGGPGTTMVITSGTIRDNLLMIACQYEGAAAMLHVADTMPTQKTYRPIRLLSCIIESPIVLGVSCHLISDGCRYVDNIEVTAASGVKIDSYYDSFLPGAFTINLGVGGEVTNFMTHETVYPDGVRGPIINGQMQDKGTVSPVAGKSYFIGDIRWNLNGSPGSQAGWRCIAAGNPGTWEPFGQTGQRVGVASPVGVLTPIFVGEEYLDTSAGRWYKSTGAVAADWVALN